ncbi:monocarboxylate transporter 14 isoform X2 [Ambystoma mexicanum]|uniref:monocarboxylate transporter 14 isoform X2 n=1 Tax=Ambystoma mexicanum TaxID=8296 RepID=UPI0037E93E1A
MGQLPQHGYYTDCGNSCYLKPRRKSRRYPGPFIGLLISTCGCRKTTIIGGLLCALGWILSAYAINVHYLFITFGVIAGIGSGMVYLPAVVMVGQYFQKRRALAQGLSTTGTGFGTFLITILLKYLCKEYGWRNAMIMQGAVSLNMCVCGALMRPLPSRDEGNEHCAESGHAEDDQKQNEPLSPETVKLNGLLNEEGKEGGHTNGDISDHLPTSQTNDKGGNERTFRRMCKLRFLKEVSHMTAAIKNGFWAWYSSYFGAASLFTNKVFVGFVFWALLAYSSFVIPFIHLPEIVQMYGLTEQNDIFPLTSIIAIVHIFGKIILGIIGDLPCVSAWNVFLVANLSMGICIIILPLVHMYAGLAVLCAFIGFSSGYFSLMPVVTEDLVGIKDLANAFGIIICANGISALLGPPFAGWIYDVTQKYDYSFYVCGLLYMIGIMFLLLKPCLKTKQQPGEKTSNKTEA